MAFTIILIKEVTKKEPRYDEQCRTTKTGCVKVGVSSNERAKQSNIKLSWMVFYNICKMYWEAAEVTKKYYDDLLVINGTKISIEKNISGIQQTMDKEVKDI